jgi:hypothetical protein
MVRNWLKNLDRTNAAVAIGVWLVAFIVYLATKSPTLTFWDCGEFIACSYVLGIPHPPGTPLYVLFGRLFSLIPIFVDFAARLNFLTVTFSSLTVLFAYLVGVRILRTWFPADSSFFGKIILYAGPAAGALFLAFGKTQWGNSIEAEVYGLSMLMFTIILWLTLIYHDKPDSRAADRLMLAIVYLSFLGLAAHPATFLVFPVAAMFLVLRKDTPVTVWFLAAAYIFLELYLIFALSSRAHEVAYYIPILIVFIVYLFYVFSLETIPRVLLYIALGFALAIAPVYQVLIETLRSVSSGSAAAVIVDTSLLSIVGGVSFAALIVFSLVTLVRARIAPQANKPADPHTLVGALFVIGAAIMTLIVVAGVRGYGMFGILSVLLLAILGGIAWRHVRWPVLIAVVGVAMSAIGVKWFFFGSLTALAILLIGGLAFRLQGWKSAFLIVIVAWLGFSIHIYLPVRSVDQPAINENNTSQSLTTLVNFLDRKQYISQSMVERMFVRRGEWENQFGNYRRMGFWRFFNDQWGLNGPKFFILFVFGLLGLWEAIRYRSQFGLLIALLVLISSVGLVLYMNFADGTRQNPTTGGDYLEVRDRDYFWTPAFLFFGLAIGMGISAALQYIRGAVARLSSPIRNVIVSSSLVLFLLPIYPLARNYREIDRSNNYVAYDYGWNLLQTADPNAVFFTYGDNDTFPLWCLQEAFGVRKDVKVVNLSLANTKWYIKQVRDVMGLDLGWDDRQIDALRPYRTTDGLTFQLQDQVVDAIIDRNRNSHPINFSVTVADDGRSYHGRSADSHLSVVGMKWRFREDSGAVTIDADASLKYFLDPEMFRLRGLNDSTVYKDDNMLRLTSNYTNSLLLVADTLRKARRYADAEKIVKLAVDNIPYTPESVEYLASLYAEQGKVPELRELVARGTGDVRRIAVFLGRAQRKVGDRRGAEATLKQALTAYPSYRPALEEMVRLYLESQELATLRTVLADWMQANPADKQAADMLRQLDVQLNQSAKPASNSK